MNVIGSVRFGLLVGSLISILMASAITFWEWLENPSGIFHGQEGTHWNFVLETAISWLVPTFALAALAAFAGHFLVSGVRLFIVRRDNARASEGDA